MQAVRGFLGGIRQPHLWCGPSSSSRHLPCLAIRPAATRVPTTKKLLYSSSQEVIMTHSHEVTLYTKQDCPLCQKAKDVLQRVQAQIPFQLKEVDILKCDQETLHRYCFHIPVVHLNGSEVFRHRVDEGEMLSLLRRLPPTDTLQ